MSGAFLGPEFSQSEIERRLAEAGARFSVLNEDEMIEATAKALADQFAVGWFQGRMEFGPRSLGARSISRRPAHARDAEEPQSQGQVPREFSPVCAGGAARGTSGNGSNSIPTAPIC